MSKVNVNIMNKTTAITVIVSQVSDIKKRIWDNFLGVELLFVFLSMYTLGFFH